MRRFLMLVVLVVIAVGALGYYLGWFHVTRTDADGKPGVTVTVDKDKVHQDEQRAREKATQMKDKAADKIHDAR
jgi:hypothetical protein